MSLSTVNVLDVSTYKVALMISLKDWPLITPISKNLDVTISCEVLTLTFTTAPLAPITLRVGID